ncbi:MAG: SBBP repeat-containing protein, partial [Sphingobacteriaceae bacterium]
NLLTNLWANYYESKFAPTPKKEQSNNEELKAKARDYLAAQPVKFLENKGQMMDVNSKPVPFVLFKAEAPGMNVYITEKGLTYVFVKAEEEEHEREREKEKEREKGKLAGPEEENVKMEMAWVHVNLEGANIQRSNIIKEGQSTEHFNYFYGHCPEGIYDVYQYDKITIRDVYPGIDWVFYNSEKTGMKYDFVVHPGADASQIKLIYEGDKPLKMEEDGSISIKTKLGTLTEAKPYTYEEGNNNEIQSNYKLTTINKNKTMLEFNLANHNTNNTLIIDPQLVWGTFFGGNGYDGQMSIETDNLGNVYVAGYTYSTNFPTVNPSGGAYYDATFNGGAGDAVIFKFLNSGLLNWATYYGGSGQDWAYSLVIDGFNNVYIAGETLSSNFPTFNMIGAYFQGSLSWPGFMKDAFVVKFSNTGVLLWATYFGGSGDECAHKLASDSFGNIYMTGYTQSNVLFPIQNLLGAYNDALYSGSDDAFIVKFSVTGQLLWGTFFGGSGFDRAYCLSIDGSNNVYIAGLTSSTPATFPIQNLIGAYNQPALAAMGSPDCFIAKFSNTGLLVWSTYFGGTSIDCAYSLVCDQNNDVYITGQTQSNNLPIQNLVGAYNNPIFNGGTSDAFLTKFSSGGNLDWSTFLGGSGLEEFNSYDNLEIDNCGNVYLSFETRSNDATIQTWQPLCLGFNDNSLDGIQDVLMYHFSNTGALVWSTHIGGNGYEVRSPIELDNFGNLFFTGECTVGAPSGPSVVINNLTYPLANPGVGAYFDPTFNGGNEDGFIMKFTPIPPTYAQSQTNPAGCSGCNGVATISVTCGRAPYTYQWSNSVVQANVTNTTSSITGLCPGVYQVTVTSNCNYTYTTSYTLTGSVPT